MPPAGTVFCVHPVCTRLEITGLQQPTWIVPGVFGARCPCRSLMASSWTCVSDCLATATPGRAQNATSTIAVVASFFIDVLPVRLPQAGRRPASGSRDSIRDPTCCVSRASERQLLVGHALERQPVQRRDAQTLDGVAVLGRGVADMGAELPAGVQRLGSVHEAVPADLRNDRGGGDG